MQSESLMPGMLIAGKYVVERTLGRGGMGAVYVASHVNTGKRLALKVLLPEFVHNADLVGRFLREAQVMGRLQHRHVVDVFDVGRDGDVLYIVMELLEGKPLSDLLHDASLTLEEALLILMRAMEGVSAAHQHGVVHRDLKPDNIFVCIGASGRLDDPRVLDFGISKLDDGENQQLTRSGVAMGTPYYMSIEQLSGQRDLDQRVDVYALGVILYEAMAGDPPYMADSISALAIRVLTTQAVHLGELRPDLPPGLADVVMKAIARNRDDRYRSVRALIEALRPFVPKSAGLSVPEGQGRPLRTPRSGGAHRPARSSDGAAADTPLRSGVRAPSHAPPEQHATLLDPGMHASRLPAAAQGVAAPRAPASGSASASVAPAAAATWHKPVLIGIAVSASIAAVAIFLQLPEPAPAPVIPRLPTHVPAASQGPTAVGTQPADAPQDRTDDLEAARIQAARAASASPAALPDAGAAGRLAPGTSDSPGAANTRPADRADDSPPPARGPSEREPRDRASSRKPRNAARAGEPSAAPRATVASPPPIAPAATETPPSGPPRKSAEGRAGKLGSDEF
jgi:eukaryotic-like serine/threonine-protein kinase